MNRYYLKFFEQPKTRAEFQAETKPHGGVWSRRMVKELSDEGYISQVKPGKYEVTMRGERAYLNYLKGDPK